MPKGIIKFKGLRNFRSLSCVGKVDGKSIIEKRFYRSASLGHVDEEGLRRLRDEYGIRRIVDLRTFLEVREKPDPQLEGIEYFHIPVMEEADNGVARTQEKKTIAERVATYLELDETYAKLATDEYSLKRIGEAVSLCLKLKKGAVLWHCSAGKDRTGIIAFLILKMLGFSDAAILHDYLLTNGSAKRYAWAIGFQAFHATHNRALAHKVFRTFIAKKKYLMAFIDALNKSCGSVENFYAKYCGISAEEIAEFKKRFLVK